MRNRAVTCLLVSLSLALGLGLAGVEAPLSPAGKAGANGFTFPVAKGVSGPYEYLVGIWPPVPVVGRLHMATSLTSAKTPVTDAEVLVTCSVGANQGDPAPAVSYFLQPWSYELDMELNEPGTWTFEIEINSLLGAAVIEIVLEVAGEQGSLEQPAEEPKGTQGTPLTEPVPSVTAGAPGQSQPDNPGVETPRRIMTRQAQATPTQDQPATRETTQRGDDRSGGRYQNGWFNWVLVGIPLVLLALGLGVWALNQRQPAAPGPRTGHTISRDRPRRRR